MFTYLEIGIDIPDEYIDLSLDYLEGLETISEGHTDDLKIHDDIFKVWLCRCGMDDGMPYDNAVSIEMLINNRWVEVFMYEAK